MARKSSILREDGHHRCARCHQWKPPDNFRRDKNRATGLYPYCKPCSSEYDKLKGERRRARGNKKKLAELNRRQAWSRLKKSVDNLKIKELTNPELALANYLRRKDKEKAYQFWRMNNKKGFQQLLLRKLNTPSDPPELVLYHNSPKYVFLHNVYEILEWAKESLKVTDKELKCLLAMHPLGVWDRHQWKMVHPNMNYPNVKKLLERGLIELIYDAGDKNFNQYRLAQRTSYLLGQMHVNAMYRGVDAKANSHPLPKSRMTYLQNVIEGLEPGPKNEGDHP